MTGDFHVTANISLWCALAAWMLAQTLKFVFASIRSRQLDFRVLVSLGGTPSSHSAMVSALATSVGLRSGFSSSLFAVSLVFAAIVMFDAQSVRRAAGSQARLLNQLVEELFKGHHFGRDKLVELLGHTPTEVFLGLAMGVFMALLIHAWWILF